MDPWFQVLFFGFQCQEVRHTIRTPLTVLADTIINVGKPVSDTGAEG